MTITPLRLSLLAAISLHLLLLTGWQILRGRQPSVGRLEVADDTPILLQYSRQDPLSRDQLPPPLPPATPLPPPTGPAVGSVGMKAGHPGSRGRAQPQAPPAAQAAVLRQAPARRLPVPVATRSGAGRPDRSKPRSAHGAPNRGSVDALALGPGTPARGALLALLRGQSLAGAGELRPTTPAEPRAEGAEEGGDAASPSRVKALPASERKASEAAARLWALGRPPAKPPIGLEGLPDAISIRQLPLREALRSNPDVSHGRVLHLEDGALLLWIDAGRLWLLRAAAPH